MSDYGELDPMIGHRMQFAFKDKREHIAKVSMPNIAYPNQHIDIEITHGSRDHVIVPDTVKITFRIIRQGTYCCKQCRHGTCKQKVAHAWFKRH